MFIIDIGNPAEQYYLNKNNRLEIDSVFQVLMKYDLRVILLATLYAQMEYGMSNIVEFPGKSTQGWLKLERAIRKTMQEAGAPSEMQESICTTMKDVFNKYDIDLGFSVSLPLPTNMSEEQKDLIKHEINKGVDILAKRIHTLTMEVFSDRLALEIELYGLRNSH